MKKPIVTYRRVANPESSSSDEQQRKALQDHLERIAEMSASPETGSSAPDWTRSSSTATGTPAPWCWWSRQ